MKKYKTADDNEEIDYSSDDSSSEEGDINPAVLTSDDVDRIKKYIPQSILSYLSST